MLVLSQYLFNIVSVHCSVNIYERDANRWLEDTSRDGKITSRWVEAHVEMIKLLIIL